MRRLGNLNSDLLNKLAVIRGVTTHSDFINFLNKIVDNLNIIYENVEDLNETVQAIDGISTVEGVLDLIDNKINENKPIINIGNITTTDNPEEVGGTVIVNGNTYTINLVIPEGGSPSDVIKLNDDDLTYSESEEIQLADRDALNGMGYIILRKGQPVQSQMQQANTIYEVRYNFNLLQESVNIPSNSILKFVGGSFSNGTLNGTNKAKIDAPYVRIFSDNLSLTGSWDLKEFPVSWYGGETGNSNVDISSVICKILEQLVNIYPGHNASGGHPFGGIKITLLPGAYYAKTEIPLQNYTASYSRTINGVDGLIIEGSSTYGTYIWGTSGQFFINSGVDGTGSAVPHWGLCLRYLTFYGGNGIRFIQPHSINIEHCNFYNGGTGILFMLTVNSRVSDCEFYNMTTAFELNGNMGSGPSTTCFLDRCWIQNCGTGINCHSSFVNNPYELYVKDCIIEYCRTASIDLSTSAVGSRVYFNDTYFEGNPISPVGLNSSGLSICFTNCYMDTTDSGFAKYICELEWSGAIGPKIAPNNLQSTKGLSIIVNGKTLFENRNGHIVKTAGYFDERPDILYDDYVSPAKYCRIKVTNDNGFNEGLWTYDSSVGYFTKVNDIIKTFEVQANSGGIVSQGGTSNAIFEAWYAGNRSNS